jgi:hypothetical protein
LTRDHLIKIFYLKNREKNKNKKTWGGSHPQGPKWVVETTPKPPLGWFQPLPWLHGGGRATPGFFFVSLFFFSFEKNICFEFFFK